MTPPAHEQDGVIVGSAAVAEEVSAADIIVPGPGEAVVVAEGVVLVFSRDRHGRRLPLATVHPGECAVGCAPGEDGSTLLLTGLPGTSVVRVGIEHLDDTQLTRWAEQLCDAVAGGRWPRKVISVADAGAMVSPGECISVDPGHRLQWVRLRRGQAELCGLAWARMVSGEAALPLPRAGWLTAGLRCQVVAVAGDADADRWSAGLDVLARLAMAGAAQRRSQADHATVQRLERRSEQADLAAQDAVDVLAASAGAGVRVPVTGDSIATAELAAATEVARAEGLLVTDDALARAAMEVEAGRDPATAVAANVDARVRPVTLEQNWWRRERSAMVVQVDLDGSGQPRPAAALWRRGWVIVDSVGGAETRVTPELAARVYSRALELLPVLPSQPAGLRDLGRLALRGSRRELLVVLFVTALLVAISFVTPYLFGQLANLFVAFAPNSAYLGLFGALLMVVVAGTAWQALRALALLRARSQASAISSGALWERIMRQPARWHSDRDLGDRTAQASAVNSASAALPDETVTRLLDTATIVGSLAAVATTTSTLLAGLAVVLATQLLLMGYLLRTVARRASERVNSAAAASGQLMEILRAVNRLRVAGAESRAYLRWAQIQAQFVRSDRQLRRVTMAQGVVIAVWPTLALTVLVATTAASNASFGDFLVAQSAASMATMAIASMALSANGALVARQSLRKAEPALASVPEGGVTAGVQPGLLSGRIEVTDLVFRYSPDGPAVLDHVSFQIRPGEQVAFVGPSGCGKTTLMRVLLGLETPESGVIAVDGRDLAALDAAAVRRQVGSVLQSSSLLPVTIRQNIDMGRSMTTAQVWEALDAAAVGNDVRALAMGLDTPVTDGGGGLSGGQRQRVLIARALAGGPRILVFDEATSALDNVTQAAVVESLEALRITRIVVAHRLSTIRNADRIIVMADGRICDEGTFDELMARPGPFKDLAERQQA